MTLPIRAQSSCLNLDLELTAPLRSPNQQDEDVSQLDKPLEHHEGGVPLRGHVLDQEEQLGVRTHLLQRGKSTKVKTDRDGYPYLLKFLQISEEVVRMVGKLVDASHTLNDCLHVVDREDLGLGHDAQDDDDDDDDDNDDYGVTSMTRWI